MHDYIKLQAANENDIGILVNHHVAMFKEIMEIESKQIDDQAYRAMAVSYEKKLTEQLPDGTCRAWILFQGSTSDPVASVALSIIKMVPTPFDATYIMGYLHSMYTEREWRKRGYAEKLIKTAIQDATNTGINRIDLAPSLAGKRVYEKLGFQEMKSLMRLQIKDA